MNHHTQSCPKQVPSGRQRARLSYFVQMPFESAGLIKYPPGRLAAQARTDCSQTEKGAQTWGWGLGSCLFALGRWLVQVWCVVHGLCSAAWHWHLSLLVLLDKWELDLHHPTKMRLGAKLGVEHGGALRLAVTRLGGGAFVCYSPPDPAAHIDPNRWLVVRAGTAL